jgi:hypothetical protein
MATPELSRQAPAAVATLPRAFALAYVGVWASTFSCALALELLGGGAESEARKLIDARLDACANPPPQFGHVLALAAHNLPIVSWPLLLTVIGVHRRRIARLGADGLLAIALILNIAPVGAALGVYGARLIAFIPQLPIEWAALSLGAASWLCQRRRVLRARQVLAVLGAITALVTIAAVLETAAVPHR